MEIREYRESDLEAIVRLFYDTVHNINIRDYSSAQIEVWTAGIDMERWNSTLSEHLSLVALDGSVVIGFGDIDESAYLDRLYVHHMYQRQGVGAALCDRLESSAEGRPIRVHASITAKPFFEKRGYRVLKSQVIERKGVLIPNYIIELDASAKI